MSDLLAPAALENLTFTRATSEDALGILALQQRAYQSEAELYEGILLPPLQQTLESLQEECETKTVLKALAEGQLIGSIRGYQLGEACFIERLIVAPEFQGRGIGSALLRQLENDFAHAKRFELFTGHRSEKNLKLYQKLGYPPFKHEQVNDSLTLIYLEKYREELL